MNTKKPIEILNFVIVLASTIVELNELWKKIEPDVKKIFNPLVDAAKKFELEPKQELKQLSTTTKEHERI